MCHWASRLAEHLLLVEGVLTVRLVTLSAEFACLVFRAWRGAPSGASSQGSDLSLCCDHVSTALWAFLYLGGQLRLEALCSCSAF